MPIAVLFIRENLWNNIIDAPLATTWAKQLNLPEKDISVTAVPYSAQDGYPYDVKVTLYLPDLWPDVEVEKIQISLHQILVRCLGIPTVRILILSLIVQSGHVIDNGKVQTW